MEKRNTGTNICLLAIMVLLQGLLLLLPINMYNTYFMIIVPLSYLALAAFAAVFIGFRSEPSMQKRSANIIMVSGALLYICILFFSGILFGFGSNPMFTTAGSLIKNLWRHFPLAILGEVIRFQIVTSTRKRRRFLMIIIVTFVYTFTMIDNLTGFAAQNMGAKLDYVFTSVLPLLVFNFLLSYVCESGALSGCLFFRTVYSLIIIFAPYLPAVSNLYLTFVMYVLVFVLFVAYERTDFAYKLRRVKKSKPFKWYAFVLPGAVLTVLVLFGLGALPVSPVAIVSGSMHGEFDRGAMVFVKKLSTEQVIEQLKVGDIAEFLEGNTIITHRVVAIGYDENGFLYYTTKGDNNSAEDDFRVMPDKVRGIVVWHISYLGYPAVILKELMSG